VSECAADRLPAEGLDRIMLDRLLDPYSHDDILQRALAGRRERGAERQQNLRDELAVIEAGGGERDPGAGSATPRYPGYLHPSGARGGGSLESRRRGSLRRASGVNFAW
jgi:hypothetical protein